jgi:hypothetical protein
MIHVNIRNIFNFKVNAYFERKNIVICFKILIELICFKMLGVLNTKHINSNQERNVNKQVVIQNGASFNQFKTVKMMCIYRQVCNNKYHYSFTCPSHEEQPA